MLSYKFKEKIYLCNFFAKSLLGDIRIYNFIKEYDIITFVPIHKKRKLERGYNQTEVIARILAKKVEDLICLNTLVKYKNNLKQSSLSLEKRKDNVKNVYKVLDYKELKGQVENKSILLFDDIYTTGYTILECKKELKKLNPKKIGVLTIFKD